MGDRLAREIHIYARRVLIYLRAFFKWVLLGSGTGLVCGLVGSAFHYSVEWATEFRGAHGWILYLLPAAGLVIIGLYRLSGLPHNIGTNDIFESVRAHERVSILLAPLIFVGTVLTHLCGGSAGREGAALQLGGSIGARVGRLFRLREVDMSLIILCGMSGVFAALFGTPLTATLFALEVVSVGRVYYAGLVPCVASSFGAYGVSRLLRISPVAFSLTNVPPFTILTVLQSVGVGAVCAVASILFCALLHLGHKGPEKLIKNEFLRVFCGGALLVGLTLLIGTREYNGAGMDVVARAIGGQARPEAFFLKMVFTALTIGVGFKGGEIVPTFFIGSTLGCVVGPLLGLDAGFAAALGLASMFCGVVNCPIASIALCIELFGAQGLPLFVCAAAVSYMLSGYYGLYSSQKITVSKYSAQEVKRHAHQ